MPIFKRKKVVDVIALDEAKVNEAVEWINNLLQTITEQIDKLENEVEPDLAAKTARYQNMLTQAQKAKEQLGKLLNLFR